MHDPNFDLTFNNDNFDINLEEISKIEGAASLSIKIRNKKIDDLRFSISEWKRFYTQSVIGKPIVAIPSLLSRICGTCSNAHLLCAIEAIEKGLSITPSPQTMILRKLLYYGLIIRDHALHLYIFSLPDYFGKNSILDFDEKNPKEHQFLDDAFSLKEIGNKLSVIVGGRSVHAPYPTIGGFLKLPTLDQLKNLLPDLKNGREIIWRLINFFKENPQQEKANFPLIFSGLKSPDFSFLEGKIYTSAGQIIEEQDLRTHLEAKIIPYSQARGFLFDGQFLMVGALARLNLSKENLHPSTKSTLGDLLSIFPSINFYDNNLAQAIEILHVIDQSIEMIENLKTINPEIPQKIIPRKTVGVGVIEAPRGTLFHQFFINENGLIEKAEIIVPTGQNQIVMEKGISQIVERLLKENASKEKIINEVEKFIRAFDPCMSCAAHFLKVKWKED
jgi:sulfhydrogenase subunit alpha